MYGVGRSVGAWAKQAFDFSAFESCRMLETIPPFFVLAAGLYAFHV